MFSTRTRATVGLVATSAMVFGGLFLVAPASADENPPPDEVTTQQTVETAVTGSITINKAGIREGNTSTVSGLAGALFKAYPTTSNGTEITGLTSAGECTTIADGTCTISLTDLPGSRYVVVEASAPSPWLALRT